MKLIDTPNGWTKLWSVRLAALAGSLATYLVAFPDQRDALLALIPDGPWRVLAAFGFGFVVFAVPTVTRLAQQPTKGGGNGDDRRD
jgi:hypothetical protein